MTIAAIATMGSDQNAASATSATFTTATTQIVAGDFALLAVAIDNLGSGADADNVEVTSVTGGTGTWTKCGEWSNTNAGAGNGCTISVWMFQATGTTAVGTVFTVNFSAAVVEKAMVMHGFSKAAGTSIVVAAGPIASAVDASNDFGSAVISGLASASRLYFAGYAKEANSATAITPSAGFTATGRTRSQAAASAVLVRGEFIIATSTGQTSAPVLAVSGDTAGVFVALVEATSGSVAKTLDAETSSAQVGIGVTATVAVTLGDETSSASGDVTSVRQTGMLPHRGARRRGRGPQ